MTTAGRDLMEALVRARDTGVTVGRVMALVETAYDGTFGDWTFREGPTIPTISPAGRKGPGR